LTASQFNSKLEAGSEKQEADETSSIECCVSFTYPFANPDAQRHPYPNGYSVTISNSLTFPDTD
jgi:hypothetical protein